MSLRRRILTPCTDMCSNTLEDRSLCLFRLLLLLSQRAAMGDMEMAPPPSWMGSGGGTIRAAPGDAGAPAAKAAKAAAKSAAAAAKGKAEPKGKRRGGRDDIEALVCCVTRLSLSQSRDIGELAADRWATLLVPGDSRLAEVVLQGKAEYDKGVQDLRKRKKEWEEDADDLEEEPDLAAMGSLHVFLFGRLLCYLTEAAKENDMVLGATLMKFWNEKFVKADQDTVYDLVSVCRAKKPPKQSKKKGKFQETGYVKLTLGVKDREIEHAMVETMKLLGSEHLRGTAPRGYLERESAALLQKITTGAKSSTDGA